MLKINGKIRAIQLFLIISLVFLAKCKKEEEPRIEILNLKSFTNIYERDTLKIEYYVVKNNLDSVCLLIDGQIYQTKSKVESTIIFIPESYWSSQKTLKLAAYYHSGMMQYSSTYYIGVYNLFTPELQYIVKRDDGLPTYFVGEKLSITVMAKYDHDNLNDFKQVLFYLNDDSLGSATSAPYTFTSKVIEKEQNQISVILKDINNRIHYVKQDLIIPKNTAPEIKLDFGYRHNIPPGYFFSSDSIVLVLNGSDNSKINNIDYYLDDKLYLNEPINSDRISYHYTGIGKLLSGVHKIYCVAFDDRGLSTNSEILTIRVYKDIDLNEGILDVEYSDSEESLFLLANSKLFVLNPILEEVASTLDLPFSNAVSMDFVSAENKLYIASRQGKLFTWDMVTKILNEVELSGISNIGDIEIDFDHNLALISNNKLLVINLTSRNTLSTNYLLDPESTLIFDKVHKIIIAGGNTHLSSGYVYLYQLKPDTLIYKRRANIGGFGNKLQLSPNGDDFIISPKPRDLRNLINSYHTSDLSLYRTYQQSMASVTAYSTNGDFIFISDNWECILNLYDTKNMSKIKSFPIPVESHDYLNHLLPNINNSRLVITTVNAFTPLVKIVFVKLN